MKIMSIRDIEQPWTTEQLNLLKRLVMDNSAAECGEIMGRSKGSIVGCCRRRGIALHGRDKQAKTVNKSKPIRIIRKQPSKNAGRPVFKPLPSMKDVTDTCVKWPDKRYLADGYCRSILGDIRAMECCGEKTDAGHSFCARHEAVYYTENMYRPSTFARWDGSK